MIHAHQLVFYISIVITSLCDNNTVITGDENDIPTVQTILVNNNTIRNIILQLKSVTDTNSRVITGIVQC